MSVTVVTPPSFDAVSADDMMSFLHLNDDTESDLISSLVQAATDQFTNDTGGHVLCSQTLRLALDNWPDSHYCRHSFYQSSRGTITIPRGPVSSVTSVQYLDAAGSWQTLTGWTADTSSTAARVILPSSLPALHASQLPAVKVTFVAGYADGAIPASALVGVRLLASHWYEQRTAFSDTELKPLPAGWAALTARYALGINHEVNR